MTVTITVEHNEARLGGTLAFLNTGAGRARCRLYGSTRPGLASDAPGSTMLAEIELTDPAGSVASGLLTLVQEEDGMVAVTGTVTWARFVNGNGDTAFDCDAGQGPGAWEVELDAVALYAGGGVRMVSCVLG